MGRTACCGLIVALAVIACRTPSDPKRSANGVNASASPRSKDAAVAPAATASLAPASSAPRAAARYTPVARDGRVRIDPSPFCGLSKPSESDAGATPPSHTWRTSATAQKQLEVLSAELEPYAPGLIGITFDDVSELAIVVLQSDFEAYEPLRSRLLERLAHLRVTLRPGCFTREELVKVQRHLEARDFHPNARSVAMAWGLDAAFSGYTVTIADSAPEVAKALGDQLGPVVRVKLGRPERL